MFRRSLRARLVGYFLLLSLLTVAIIGVVVNVRATDDLRAAAVDHLSTAADSRASAVQRWLEEQRRNVTFSAGLFEESSDDRAAITTLLGTGSDAEAARDEVRATLAYVVRQSSATQELMVLDLDGTIQVSTFTAHEGAAQADEPYFTRAVSGGGIVGVFDWQLIGEPSIAAVAPIEVDGERVAVLAGILDLSRIHAVLLERVGIGPSGVTYIVSPSHRGVPAHRGHRLRARRRGQPGRGVRSGPRVRGPGRDRRAGLRRAAGPRHLGHLRPRHPPDPGARIDGGARRRRRPRGLGPGRIGGRGRHAGSIVQRHDGAAA
jgi:hypothetical protein